MSTGGNIGPPRWGRRYDPKEYGLPIFSTSVVNHFVCSTVAPFTAGDISSESEATISEPTYHARCPYCGTARKPFTYVNCINCGAPA